jgi:dihydrofolate reductase
MNAKLCAKLEAVSPRAAVCGAPQSEAKWNGGQEDTMARWIVMFNWLTANGYFAGADGNLEWVVPDEEQAKAAVDSIPLFDTVLFGRRTYEVFEKFWTSAIDNSPTAPDPHDPGQRTKEHGALAVWLNETTKLVFSKSLKSATWKNSRVLRELDPQAIAAMKNQSGKDMIIFGSGSIVSQLTQHGLIDEYQLVVCPIFLGSGRPLLNDLSKNVKLNLVEYEAVQVGRRLPSLWVPPG